MPGLPGNHEAFASGGAAHVTQVSPHPADPPGSVGSAGRTRTPGPLDREGPPGPIERLMSTLIRKLAWSRLANPKVAVTLSGAWLLLGMVLGATSPNAETIGVRLPLSLLPSLVHQTVLASLMLYSSLIL